VIQYTIDGRPGYDPESFLEVVEELIANELRSVDKMILRCMMQKQI